MESILGQAIAMITVVLRLLNPSQQICKKIYGGKSLISSFSLLIDGSTDSGNIDEELFMVLYFDPHCDAEDGMVYMRDMVQLTIII